MGVEPTKDRLAAPPGFEVRTPHRGRFSSRSGFVSIDGTCVAEQVEPMPIDAANVTTAHGDAVPIKEFQDLDRNLAAIFDAVTELRCTELAVSCTRAAVDHDFDHFGNGVTQEKVIVRDFVNLPHLAEQLENPANVGFARGEQTRNVTNARRTK